MDITNNGLIGWFLGFQIKRDRKNKTLLINQHAYIESLAKKYWLTNAKPVKTPIEPGTYYAKEQCPSMPNQVAKMNSIPYSEAIGSVLWPAIVSRPDVAYAIGILSQFIQNPGQLHWEGVKQIISYLYSTKDHCLTFCGKGKKLIKGFSDADWASQRDRHSISGYVPFLGCGAITWSSKKQHIIALSSTRSKYIAQTHAPKEVIWIRSFILEIQQDQSGPIDLLCDNQGAIALAKDNKFHVRTKHIDLRHHFIREAVKEEKIKVTYIPSEENVADIFMKALARPKYEGFVKKLGLRNEGVRATAKPNLINH